MCFKWYLKGYRRKVLTGHDQFTWTSLLVVFISQKWKDWTCGLVFCSLGPVWLYSLLLVTKLDFKTLLIIPTLCFHYSSLKYKCNHNPNSLLLLLVSKIEMHTSTQLIDVKTHPATRIKACCQLYSMLLSSSLLSWIEMHTSTQLMHKKVHPATRIKACWQFYSMLSSSSLLSQSLCLNTTVPSVISSPSITTLFQKNLWNCKILLNDLKKLVALKGFCW